MKIADDFLIGVLATVLTAIIFSLLLSAYREPSTELWLVATTDDVEVVDPIPHRDKVRWPDQTEDKLPGDSIVEKPEFSPHKFAFTLDDGTPCVWFSVPSYNSRKANASGVSCDWGYQDDHELIF